MARRRLAAGWPTADGGVVRASAIDGAQRVIAWHRLPDWDVLVTSSVDKDVVLAPWRRSTLIYGFVAMVASALLGTLAWSLLRERRILDALHTSEQRLALFIDRAPAAIAMFDADMRYLAASRRYIEDYGLTASGPETLLGRSHYDVFPTITDRWRAIHRRVLAGETLSADDDPFPREDGRCDWVRWELSPWYNGDGRIGGAVLFSEVVTARKHAEAALRESELRFRSLVNAASNVVYRMNPDWTEMRQLDGHGFLSNVGSPSRRNRLTEYIHPDDQPQVREAIQTAIRTKSAFELEHRVWRADGSIGWTASRAIPLLDAEGEIREWFGAAVSGILWTNNAEGKMAGEQPGWATLTGQSQEDYQGYGWAKAVHPDDSQPSIDAWNAAVAERRPLVFEHRVRRHDGTWRRFAIRAIPVLDEDGTIREWVGVHTDVTEQREAEEPARKTTPRKP